jgi:hypothetical protein
MDELTAAMEESGFNKESIARIKRLLQMQPTESEKKRWEETGIIKDGQIQADKDEVEHFDIITIALWDLCYLGGLKRHLGSGSPSGAEPLDKPAVK